MYVMRLGDKDCGHKHEILHDLAACIKNDANNLEDDRLPNGQACKLVDGRLVNLAELPEGRELAEILMGLVGLD
jgi:hypothetical protein